MNIRQVPPKQTIHIQALERLDLPDPGPETVKDIASQTTPLGSKESFTELQHPTALDKMLLPASPQLVFGAVKKEMKTAEEE